MSSRCVLIFVLLLASLMPTAKMTGILFPLYIYPGTDWDTIISLKATYPSLPMTVIINPSSGPGTSADSVYVTYIGKLQTAGITVVGYDHTSYASRSSSDVQADIDGYYSFYPNIDGIFFDEMQYQSTGYETYYSDLRAYAKSKGFSITYGNPGTKLPVSYMSTLDYIVIFEDSSTADLTTYGSYSSYLSQLAMISTTQSTLPTSWVEATTQMVSWLYVTDDSGSNPYDTLPSYLSTLAELLDAANKENATKKTTTTSKKTTISKTVIIIISVVGGVAVLLMASILAYTFLGYRRRRKTENEATQAEAKPSKAAYPNINFALNPPDGTAVIDVSERSAKAELTSPKVSLAETSPLRADKNRRNVGQPNGKPVA